MGSQYGPLFTPILFSAFGQQPRTYSELKRFICPMGADESDHSSSITTSSHLMDSIAKKKCPHVFHIRSCLFIFCHPGNFGFFIFERWEMLGSNNFWQVVSHEIAVFFFLLPFIRNNSIRPLVWVPGSSQCFVIVTISSRLSLCLSEDEMWGKDEAIG